MPKQPRNSDYMFLLFYNQTKNSYPTVGCAPCMGHMAQTCMIVPLDLLHSIIFKTLSFTFFLSLLNVYIYLCLYHSLDITRTPYEIYVFEHYT